MPTKNIPEKTPRLIKKYPNRRLYDTKTSTYITLDDIRGLVISGERFQVIDAKTDENLTRAVFLQIILEAEAGGTPLFTEEALAMMIRFYGNTFQGAMGPFLEQNITAFLELQLKLQEQQRSLFGRNPYAPDHWLSLMPNKASAKASAANAVNAGQLSTQTMVANYVERSTTMFAHMQAQMQAAMQAQTRAMFGDSGAKK
jgi:polyhydroxyalkanoate synthesis repressor PhaR